MSEFAQGFQVGANIREQRDARRQLAEQRNENLQILGYSFKDGQMNIRPGSQAEQAELAAQEAIVRSKDMMKWVLSYQTARAFEDFAATGDANYLNNDLNSSPEKKAAWNNKGVMAVSNIDFENDGGLLSRVNLSPSTYDTPEKREILKRNMYKVYDGKDWTIGLANKAMAETGAYKTLGQRRAQGAMDNYKALVELMNSPRISGNTAEGSKYSKEINAAAEEFNLPPDLLAAVIGVESSGNPTAVSPKGAGGLMQLMPETATELGVTDVNDPAQNIKGGAKYIRQMMDRYGGDLRLAMAAYNAGPGAVDKYGGIPPFGETQNYIRKLEERLDEGGSYYGRTAQDMYSSVLEYDRRKALASAGKTAEQADDENLRANIGVMQNERLRDQSDRQLDQADRGLDQKDTELGIQRDTLGVRLKEAEAKLISEGVTTTQKDLSAGANKLVQLYDKFGGEEAYFNKDFTDSNSKDYRDADQLVSDAEQLLKRTPSETDKKEMRDLGKIVRLSVDAVKLGSKETGFVDKRLSSVKKYIDENFTGSEAASAWAAVRNVYVHAMAGATQTQGETQRLQEAIGTLDQQLGPVLTGLLTLMKEQEASLESLKSNMLPAAVPLRLGVSENRLAQSMQSLRTTIGYLEAKEAYQEGKKGTNPGTLEDYIRNQGAGSTSTTLTPSQTADLENIFSE